MGEIFKTVLILSALGFVITAFLLCIKPITTKKFSAKWQYYVWIAVLCFMIIPTYKLVPVRKVQKFPVLPQNEVVQNHTNIEAPVPTMPVEKTIIITDENISSRCKIPVLDLFASIWFLGMCLYLIVVLGSYVVYVIRKRKNAILIKENTVISAAKKEIGIKRYIKIRMTKDFESPMLVGLLFPVIYIPSNEIPDENMRMVFLHELMHYKRKDLAFKWLAIFVNAVHWFNPLVYLLCSNVSEACEVSCDMAVTKNMSENEQKLYMKTILDLAR